MVLDARTIDSLHALAAVVQEYVSPNETPAKRSRRPLTSEQMIDACFLRWNYGWHAWHIAEAMGLAVPPYTNNWEDNIVEALEQCAQSDYWNTQGIRLKTAPSWEDQTTLEGTQVYAKARVSAIRNAYVQVLWNDPSIRSRDIPPRADKIITDFIEAGTFRGQRPLLMSRQTVNGLIREITQLGFVWEGAGRTQIMALLSEEQHQRVDAEILRQCEEAGGKITYGRWVSEGGEVPINYSQIARDVWSKFLFDPEGHPGETLEKFEVPAILPSYVLTLCQGAGVTEKYRVLFTDFAAKEENQKRVKDLRDADPTISVERIMDATGFNRYQVNAIYDALGISHGLVGQAEVDEIRDIAIRLYDELQLTTAQMYDQSAVIRGRYRNKHNAESSLRSLLVASGRTPITRVIQEATRRLPAVAGQIKSIFLSYLRNLPEEEKEMIRSTVARSLSAGFRWAYETQITAPILAEWIRESPELTQQALDLLFAEPSPLIALDPRPERADEIIFPLTTLRTIITEGGTIPGEPGL